MTMKSQKSKKKSITMAEVFRDLPIGYWRNAKGETLALRDMDTAYLENVREFLFTKREWTDFVMSNRITTDLWDDDDLPTERVKNPMALQYVIKIIEINVELKRRREECGCQK